MEQYAAELMHRYTKPKTYSQIYADGVNDIFGLDLADMAEWSSQNDGFKFILVCVDIFSRFAWCVPLKTKNAAEVWAAFESVIKHNKPRNIWVDRGGEFYNKVWDVKLKNDDIKRYSTYGEYKVSMAERFIQTLKSHIWKQFIIRGRHEWLDILPAIVAEYNNTRHSSIGMTPTEARDPRNAAALFELVKESKPVKPKYKIGDWVRIARIKGKFEKGFHPNFSYEIYRIVGIKLDAPTMYELADYGGELIEGKFYEAELTPVSDPDFFPVEKVLKERTKGGRREVLVQFLGYKEPEWLPKSHVFPDLV